MNNPYWLTRLSRVAYCLACIGAGVALGLAARAAWIESDELVQRRERLSDLSSTDKLQLIQRQQRFEGLEKERQERLRRLHQDLDNAKDEEQLRSVMRQYYEWLGEIEEIDQAELLELAADLKERVERVKAIQKERRKYQPFSDKDLDYVVSWVEQRLAGQLDDEETQRLADAQEPHHRRMEVVRIGIAKWGFGRGAKEFQLADEQFVVLMNGLNPIARERIEEWATRMEEWSERRRWGGEGGRGGPGAPNKDDKEGEQNKQPEEKRPANELSPNRKRYVINAALFFAMKELTRQAMRIDLEREGVTTDELRRFLQDKLDESKRTALARASYFERKYLLQRFYLQHKFPQVYQDNPRFPFFRRGPPGQRPPGERRPDGGSPNGPPRNPNGRGGPRTPGPLGTLPF